MERFMGRNKKLVKFLDCFVALLLAMTLYRLYLGITSLRTVRYFFFIFFLPVCFYAQELKITVKTDTTSNEITTYISLINIPDGKRVRFQQRLLPNAKLVKLPTEFLLWDTANSVLTLITANYPPVDTLNFAFVCRSETLPDVIFWGEAALMYENKKGEVKKITSAAKNYFVRQPTIPETYNLTKGMYYIQVSASKTVQNSLDVAKLVHLQNEHSILDEKTDKYYKYYVGQFATKEQAIKQLSYYKQYVSDAFVVHYK